METDPSLKRELIHAVEKHALTFGKFTLKSGASSHFYLDCKKLILSPRGLWLVVQMIRNEIDWERYDAVGGPSIGADPIIGGLIYDIGQEVSGDKVRGFIVRPELKAHGIQKRIIGNLEKGDRVVLVEDVSTSGGSLISVADYIEGEMGCRVVEAISIIDRQAGATEAFAKRKIKFGSLLTLDDINLNPPALT